jgi:hypothetical protein
MEIPCPFFRTFGRNSALCPLGRRRCRLSANREDRRYCAAYAELNSRHESDRSLDFCRWNVDERFDRRVEIDVHILGLERDDHRIPSQHVDVLATGTVTPPAFDRLYAKSIATEKESMQDRGVSHAASCAI